ncbi:MAG: Ig-like domain-containing protein [Bacteroidota bacterium]
MCAGLVTPFTTDGTPGGVWSSDNTSVAVVDPSSGVVTGVNAGSAVITYKVIGCGTFTTTKTITVNATVVAGTISGASSVCVGSATSFTSSGTANGAWSSDNTAVAIVNTSGIVTALTPGNATITYTVTGCGGQFSVSKQVTVNATVTAGIVSGASAICATSQTAFTASGTAGGVWSSDNTNAATVDANTGLITGVNAGSANITYTVNGCGGPSVSSKSITVNPSATAGVINGTTDLGCPGSTVQFTTTGTPGGVWSSNHPEIASVSSIGMVTCAGPGDAIITYTVTGCGGQETAQLPVTVTSNAVAGTITGGSLLPICPGSSLVFATDGTTGGVWSSSNTAVATVDETTGEINCIAAGDAMIRYTVNGCSGPVFTEKQVSIAPSVTAGTLSGSSSLCAGSSITLSRSGGVPGGTWISSNPGVATVSNTGVVTGVAAGTVSITYTVTGCNIASTPAKNVTVNASVNAGTMSGPSAVCVGATIQMATNGQSGGTWSSSNTSRATVTNAGVVKGFTAGTVTISYTLSGCGTPVANKQITITASATAGTITGATSVCAGSSITLGRSGGTAGGTWSSSNTTIATVNANGTVTGISGGNVTISYIVGCNSATATKQITISPLVTAGVISGTSNTMCPGSTPTFTSNGTAGGVWSSNHPEFATVNASTGVINCVSAGTVIITYTVNGCGGPLSAQKSITVTTSANAGLVSGTSNTMCSGSTTTFSSNGTPGGTWSSSNTNVATVNANTGLINCVSAGTAMIRYTVNGCSGPVGSTPKAITVASSVTAGTLSGSSSLCAGSTITLSRSGGTAGGTWISSNTNVATVSNTGVVTGVAAGTASITYTVTGCNTASTPAKQVTVNASVNAGIISGASSVCVSSTIQMTTNGQSGGTWSSSNTNRATVNSSGLVRGFAVGTVTISYTLNGCGTPVAQKQITINAAANAGSIAGSSSVCTGSTITLSSNGTSGGAWSSDNTSRATVNSNGVVTGISAGNVTISYKVTGCTVATATKQITVSAALTANNTQIGSNNPVCTGSTITLTAGGGSSYKWSGPNGYTSTQQNPVISNATAAKAGTYSVLISNGNCSITKSVNVTVASAVGGTVLVNGSASANTCYGNTVTISLTGQTGGVTRWEYSTNANSWQTINTNATTITRTVTSNTAFRAIVAINPSCSPTTSSVANVTVTSTGIGGTVSIANSVVCNGSSAVFSLSGNTGSVVRWEYSLNGGFTWTPVNNNTSTSLTYSNATQNRRYRAVVRSCFGNNTVYSTSTAITVINCNSRTTAEAPVTKGTEDALSVATLEATAYPNPSQSYFNLKVKSSNSADVEIKIFDITGKQVGQLKGAAIETFRFGNTLVAGTYIVEVRQGAERVTTKVIKQ